jgi:catechol 2,3-dioxygenase-like lactoylglutathione lyase family enzyme
MSEPVRPAPITHIAVRTRDVDASIDFYRRYAGFEIVHERVDDGIRVAWVSPQREDPDFAIVLLAMPHAEPVDPNPTDHFGFAVANREEVDRVAALAREEGRLKWGPVEAGPVVGYIALVRDPSGNVCEFSFGQSLRPRGRSDRTHGA